jgi:hypothetical protein
MTPTGNVFIPGSSKTSNTGCVGDVVTQHIDKHYQKTGNLLIESFKGIKIPDSYISYQKEIVTTLYPKDLISSGTGEAIVDIFRDMCGGGYIKLNTTDKEDNEQTLSRKTNLTINRALRSAELTGVGAVLRTDTGVEIYSAAEFYYDDVKRIIYTAKNYVQGNTDGIMYEKRYIGKHKGEKVVITERQFNGEQITKTKYKPYDKYSETATQYMGLVILTNNPYNTDWVGVSALHNIMGELKALDLTIQEYNKALYFTSPKTFMLSTAVEVDIDGRPNIDLTNDVYVSVDANAIEDPKKMVETQQYAFYADKFRIKIEDDLNLILTKVGLDRKVLAFSTTSVERSATEIVAEDNRMYATIENRRTQYYEQFVDIINLVNYEQDKSITINFIPIQAFNMNMVTQNVIQKFSSGLQSLETAIKELNPRFTNEEVKAEIDRIKGDKEDMAKLMQQGVTDGATGQYGSSDAGNNNVAYRRGGYRD